MKQNGNTANFVDMASLYSAANFTWLFNSAECTGYLTINTNGTDLFLQPVTSIRGSTTKQAKFVISLSTSTVSLSYNMTYFLDGQNQFYN